MSAAAPVLRAGTTIELAAQPESPAYVADEVLPNSCVELTAGQMLPVGYAVAQETDEAWLPVIDSGYRYLISSHDKVASTCYRNQPCTQLLRVLRAQHYPVVSLYEDTAPAQVGLNCLVARYFLPLPPPSHIHILPKDGNPLNLHVDNLC